MTGMRTSREHAGGIFLSQRPDVDQQRARILGKVLYLARVRRHDGTGPKRESRIRGLVLDNSVCDLRGVEGHARSRASLAHLMDKGGVLSNEGEGGNSSF